MCPAELTTEMQDGSDIAQWPFNRILRELGVTRNDAFDEFDAVRLRRQRFTMDWARMADRSRPQNAVFGIDPAISGILQRADQNEPDARCQGTAGLLPEDASAPGTRRQ